jgi:hypothetical protein
LKTSLCPTPLHDVGRPQKGERQQEPDFAEDIDEQSRPALIGGSFAGWLIFLTDHGTQRAHNFAENMKIAAGMIR